MDAFIHVDTDENSSWSASELLEEHEVPEGMRQGQHRLGGDE